MKRLTAFLIAPLLLAFASCVFAQSVLERDQSIDHQVDALLIVCDGLSPGKAAEEILRQMNSLGVSAVPRLIENMREELPDDLLENLKHMILENKSKYRSCDIKSTKCGVALSLFKDMRSTNLGQEIYDIQDCAQKVIIRLGEISVPFLIKTISSAKREDIGGKSGDTILIWSWGSIS